MITAGFCNDKTVLDQDLADSIRECVKAAGGTQSTANVHRALQADGWKRLGCLADFETRIQGLGFRVRFVKNALRQLTGMVSL